MVAETWKKNVGVHCWTLQSQRFICISTVNRACPLFPLSSMCHRVLNLTFSLFVGGQRLLEIEGLGVS